MSPTPERRLKSFLVVAGAVEICVGLLHFAMPYFYQRSPGLNAVNQAESDYVSLVTFAVGILLIAFGTLTLLFARRPHDHLDLVVGYLAIKCVLWSARLGLELLYPLGLNMFGVDPFTMVVAPGVAAETAIFFAALRQARVSLRQQQMTKH